jgi:mono/diheme cytochrome c family protein
LISSKLGALLRLDAKYRRAVLLAVAAAVILLGPAGCAPKPLPERGSSAEQLYTGRCGGCHRPFLPSTMTAAMWAEQVEAMQLKMAQAGVAPLSDSERREILDYLERNAGRD